MVRVLFANKGDPNFKFLMHRGWRRTRNQLPVLQLEVPSLMYMHDEWQYHFAVCSSCGTALELFFFKVMKDYVVLSICDGVLPPTSHT